MVRDGIYYGLAFIAVAVLVGWLTLPALAVDSVAAGRVFPVVLPRSRA